MKKISTILIIFICLIFVANLSVAKMGIKKPIAIPPEMQEMESPFELETYLDHSDSRIKEAAVMRLGQIGGSDAIAVLLKFFENEPETKGVIDVPMGVKEVVVVALRQIGGEEAKEQILKLLSDTLKFGPTTPYYYQEKRYTGQALCIIYLALEALSDFPDNNDVVDVLEKIARDQDPPKSPVMAQKARKNLIKISMKQQGIFRIEDKVNYLTDMLTGSGSGPGTRTKKSNKTEEALKNGAIEDILTDLGLEAGALPYLEKSLTRAPESTERDKAIKSVIKRIKQISKGRARTGKAIVIPSKK